MTPQEETVHVTQQLNQAMRDHLELVKAQNDSLPGVTDSAGGLGKSLDKAGMGQSKIAKTAMMAAEELEKMYRVSVQYRLAMAKGEKGSAKYNAHVDQMADTTQKVIVGLSTFAATLIGGPVLGAVVAGFTMLATNALKTAAALQKAANEQGDALSKSFQDLSEAGATAADGMGGLFKDVQRMRLNVHDLGSYTAMMAESAKELTAMGGTSREGAKQLADLTANLSDFEKGMRGLGMNNEKQAQAIMGFMKNQSNISRGQQKDYGNQSAAAKKYIEETEILTRVTGLNRKQQQDIQDRQMSQQRSGAVLRELALAGETDKIRLIQNQTAIYAKMGPEAEQGYNDILSGQINTEAAQKLNMITQGKVMQDQQDILEGRVKTDQEAAAATEGTAKVMGQIQDDMLGLAKSGGFEDVFGPFKNASEAGKISANNLAESVAKAAVEVDKLTGSIAGVDAETKRRINFENTQREEMTKEQAALATKWMDSGFTIGNEAKLLAGMFAELGKMFKDTLTGIFGDQTKQFEEYGKQEETRKKKEQEDRERYAKENEKMWKDFNQTLTVAGTNITTWAQGVYTGFLKASESAEKGMGKFSDKLVEMVGDIWKKLLNLISGLDKAKEVAGAVTDTTKKYAQKGTDAVKGVGGAVGDFFSKTYEQGFGGGAPAGGGGGGGGAPAGGGGGGGFFSSIADLFGGGEKVATTTPMAPPGTDAAGDKKPSTSASAAPAAPAAPAGKSQELGPNEKGVQPDILAKKAQLEEMVGKKLKVTSGLRSSSVNHASGLGIDIGLNSNNLSEDQRNKIFEKAISLGFTGLGAEYNAKGGPHIHLDKAHSSLTGWGSDYTSASLMTDSPFLAKLIGSKKTDTNSAPASTSTSLVDFIKGFEKFSPMAHQDFKQISIGYGTLAKSKNEGPITEAEAQSRLLQSLSGASAYVAKFQKKNPKYKWGQPQMDALSSFAYNGGNGWIDQVTDDGKRSNAEILKMIPAYNKAGGEVAGGLVRRRAAEAAMFGQNLQAAKGGVFDGPKSGYAATLHGNEAVIPLKDGAVPVSMSQEFNMTAVNLGELVNQMKYNMAVQDRMVAVLEEIRRAQTTTADNTGRMVAYASN